MILAETWIREMPEGFGQTGDETLIHPVGLAAVLVLGTAMLLLPRRWAVIPMLIIACFIPSSQIIYVLGLNFNLLRIMVIFGMVRVLSKKEYLNFDWKPLDKIILAYTISSSLIYVIQQGTFQSLINRLGASYDMLGMYLLFRCLIRGWRDINGIVWGIILISIPVSILFLLEKQTGRNLFSIFGGVPEFTLVRNERLRCQGAYAHPILAGCFWASLMPLIAAVWWQSIKSRIWSFMGIIASGMIVVCSASSTPMAGVLAAFLGGLMFVFRKYMRLIRWSILFLLIVLHFIMNGPVWSLVAKFSALGGGTGWHRYALIDGAISHFHEWALLGTKTTAHWAWGAQDVTNQYILEGVRGGFVTLCLFILIIVYAFREVGQLWRKQSSNIYFLALSWAMGVSLFVHCVNFIGVSYFGQINILWYLVLAMIGSLSVGSNQLRLNTQKPVIIKKTD